ncbi:MAG: electron transport complex subunit RsxC [Candidatus Zixiibacteriota bacterium]
MAFSFKGGVHPPDMKELAKDSAITRLPAPDVVYIPLSQHIGAPAKPIVKKGDEVKMGQKIGEAGAFVSCHIHSSVSGKVKAIKDMLDPLGRYVPTVVIENDGKDTPEYLEKHEDPLSLSKEDIKNISREAGLAGMGGATFPTFVKLSPPPEKKIDTFILNAAECEPYLTADYRLMIEMPDEVIDGSLMFAKGYDTEKAWIGVEKNKPDAIAVLQEKASGKDISIGELKVKYPQGAEKQLIEAITGRQVPSGCLPFDAACAVQNVGTAVALYEAAKLGKPLYERVVTVTGPLVKNPANILARIGTPYRDLIEAAGGTTAEPGKVISGGPMMGLAQKSLDVPVTKGTSGILVFPGDMAVRDEEVACISCAKCVDICPVRLMPTMLAQNSRLQRWEEAQKLGALDCIECGSCQYICPSHRRLLDRVRRAKAEIMAMQRKGK